MLSPCGLTLGGGGGNVKGQGRVGEGYTMLGAFSALTPSLRWSPNGGPGGCLLLRAVLTAPVCAA